MLDKNVVVLLSRPRMKGIFMDLGPSMIMMIMMMRVSPIQPPSAPFLSWMETGQNGSLGRQDGRTKMALLMMPGLFFSLAALSMVGGFQKRGNWTRIGNRFDLSPRPPFQPPFPWPDRFFSLVSYNSKPPFSGWGQDEARGISRGKYPGKEKGKECYINNIHLILCEEFFTPVRGLLSR